MNKRKLFYENSEIFNKKIKFNNDYFKNTEFLNTDNIEFEFKNNSDVDEKKKLDIQKSLNKMNKKIKNIQKRNEKHLRNIESKIDNILSNKDMEINYLRNLLYENGIISHKNNFNNDNFEKNEINNDFELSFYS